MSETSNLLRGHRVLIVEDEALIAFAVEDEIRSLGSVETYLVATRTEALAAVRIVRPSLAVLDVTLTDGGADYEVADALADGGIPFIFSSGHLPAELPDRHVGRPFVGKPMQTQEFIDAVTIAITDGP